MPKVFSQETKQQLHTKLLPMLNIGTHPYSSKSWATHWKKKKGTTIN